MAILSIKGSQPPYCRHALKCEVFAHSRFGKLEEVSAAVASSPPKTVPTSQAWCSQSRRPHATLTFVMGADHRGVDSGFSRMEVLAMIYELRVYQPVPGQMPKLLARFRDKLLPIWERHGIHPIGFWTTLVGESSNELTYILPWESLADREMRWTAFQNDPAWHKVRDDSERDGPIVASISNQILTPTPFSALK